MLSAPQLVNEVHIDGLLPRLRGYESGSSEARVHDECLRNHSVPTTPGAASLAAVKRGLMSEQELGSIETRFAEGMTAVQIVELFVSRGVRFSEATFRKYVQQGLLPRSKRVGRKGKHRGSLGLYPAKVVRRINTIKERMKDGYTIEEIQERFLKYTNVIETIEESVAEFFDSLSEDLEKAELSKKDAKFVERKFGIAERMSEDLIKHIQELSKRASRGARERYRSHGAAGSAEELL